MIVLAGNDIVCPDNREYGLALIAEVKHILQHSIVGFVILRQHFPLVDSLHLGVLQVLQKQQQEGVLRQEVRHLLNAEPENELVGFQSSSFFLVQRQFI